MVVNNSLKVVFWCDCGHGRHGTVENKPWMLLEKQFTQCCCVGNIAPYPGASATIALHLNNL